MSSGAMDLVVQLVVAVLLLLISVTLIFSIFNIVCKFENGKIKCDLIKSSLKDAIKCSYYRCEKGCGSKEAKSIEFRDFKCSDFCDLSHDLNGDKKICNEKDNMEASLYPVEYEVKTDQTLLKEDLGFAKCILETNNKDGGTMPNGVYLEEGIFESFPDEKDVCGYTHIGGTPKEIEGMTKVKVFSGVYYIYTFQYSFVLFSEPRQTVVWSQEPIEDCCNDCSCTNPDECNACSGSCAWDTFKGICYDIDRQIITCDDYSQCVDYCGNYCGKIEGKDKFSGCRCESDPAYAYKICKAECRCDSIASCEDYNTEIYDTGTPDDPSDDYLVTPYEYECWEDWCGVGTSCPVGPGNCNTILGYCTCER